MANVQLGSKALGSIVKLKENGIPVTFYVACHNYESGLNGVGRTLVVRKEGCAARKWHSSLVNCRKIKDGKMNIGQVPERWRAEVEVLLALDGSWNGMEEK